VYLKKKYAKQPLSMEEQEFVNNFLSSFLQDARKSIKFKTRLYGFINPIRSVSFFVANEDD
jgi:hypothetical protein